MNVAGENQYQAHAFHKQFENGRTSGVLGCNHTHITFSWEGGSLNAPISELEFKLGGANDSLIFITYYDLPDWCFYTADHTLLSNALLLDDSGIAAQIAVIQRKKKSQWLTYAAVAAVLVGLIWGILALKPFAVNSLAESVPISWEKELGNTVFAQYRVQAKLLEDEAVQAGLERLTAALTEHIPNKRYEFTFHIVEDPALNAFAFPGGHMVIHSGAIQKAEAPEELLGVIAHEIAHVTRRHGIKSMIDSVGVVLLVQIFIGDSTALLAILNRAAPYLLEQKFSRDNERDADATGLEYLNDARINPSGMKVFFEKIQTEYGHGTGAMDGTLNFMSTHPTTQERIERIQQHIDAMETRDFKDLGSMLGDLKNSLNASLASGNISKEETP